MSSWPAEKRISGPIKASLLREFGGAGRPRRQSEMKTRKMRILLESSKSA